MSTRDIGIVVLIVLGVLVLLPMLGGMGMMGMGVVGHGMMGGPWGGRWGPGMHLLGGLSWLLILAGLVLVVTSLVRRRGAGDEGPSSGPAESPLDILKRRLAKGEVSLEEYEKLKQELS
jgi:putative membrane protein